MICRTCETESDCRPYGPNGSMICFVCAMATPESMAETQKNLELQFIAAVEAAELQDGVAYISFGTEAGPVPAIPKKALQ